MRGAQVLGKGHTMTRMFGVAILVAACSAAPLAQQELVSGREASGGKDSRDSKDGERPEITVKVSPVLAFSPAKISLRAELKGGASDYEPFYCSTIEWDWGDGTSSENTMDCTPYEPGKSEIRRFYSNTHTYTVAGRYSVRFRMKKGERVVGVGAASVQVRPGIRDMTSDPMEP